MSFVLPRGILLVVTTKISDWLNVRVISAVVILAIILVGLAVYGKKNATQSTSEVEEVHYHAGFRIYKDNQLVDFSRPEYMHFAPCGVEDEHEEENQLEWVHLHDLISDVAHVHKSGVTWRMLLQNLWFELSQEAVFYLNGEEVTGLPDEVIAPYDRALFLDGKNTQIEEKLESVPVKEEIEQAELKTEGC